MKKRLISLLFAIMVIISIPADGFAAGIEPRASDYFSCTRVQAVAAGNQRIVIEVGVDATDMMDEVGASIIHLYGKNADGTYSRVYTFTKEAYPSMIVEDSFFGYIDVSYRGIAGKEYYAVVGCYAKNSAGSETLYFYTNVVTNY